MKKVFNLVKNFSQHCAGFRKSAFTKPSRGTSEARDEFQSTKMLNFRCWNERCHLMRGAAFTLAEVLITLGIIGVVAALTLPTLIQNYKKQTLVNQLKKVVNTIENAAQMAVADDGVSSFKDTKLLSALTNLYLCKAHGVSSSCNSGYLTVLNNYFKIIDIKGSTSSIYHDLDGNSLLPSGQTLVLTDGSELFISTSNSTHNYINVDINGEQNGPNIFGYDFFRFILLSDTGKLSDADYDWNANSPECNNIQESDYLENECFYRKIVSDGWKMNY